MFDKFTHKSQEAIINAQIKKLCRLEKNFL